MNPYSSPNANLADPQPKPVSPIKAVLLGLLVDIGGTMTAGIAIGLVYVVVQLTANGKTLEEANAALGSFTTMGLGFAVLFAIGCAFSVLGGYVCARISRRMDYRLGYVVCPISAGTGVLLAWNSYSLVQHILFVGFRCTLRRVLLRYRVVPVLRVFLRFVANDPLRDDPAAI